LQDTAEHLRPGHGQDQGDREWFGWSLIQGYPEFRLGIGKSDYLSGSHLAIRLAYGHNVARNRFDHGLQVSQASATQDGSVRRYEILVKQ